jgi:hypothetical protein
MAGHLKKLTGFLWVAGFHFFNSPVHHVEPYGRKECQYHASGITRRQLRGLIMVLKYLVFTACYIVMIAMAAQFKKHQPAHDMITVPAMLRHGPFIFAIGCLFAHQSIMFNIVHRFQQ